MTTWNDTTVREEALKYTKKSEFRRYSLTAFRYAEERGLLGEYTAHMQKVVIWNPELVRQEALKYEKRNQFKHGSRGAYNFAKTHGIFEDVCAHMPQRVRKEA